MKLDEKVRARESQGNVSTFLRNKYSEDAQAAKNWDDFYSRHRTNFFKDRHYMEDEFPELERARVDNKPRTLLEAGCGVGNTVLPLLASHSGLEIFATDFSPKAIQLLNSTPLPASAKQRMHAFVSDMSLDSTASVWEEEILQKVPGGLDIVMMIFSLSAVPPERQTVAIRNIAKVMKPGGKLLFRDYARCDHTQLKFSHENRLENNFYVRQDGTLTYFFDLSALVKTFREFGFKAVDTRHVERVIANRSTGAQMTRIWIHGTFEYTG
jgi:methyltransferase-like protein 6